MKWSILENKVWFTFIFCSSVLGIILFKTVTAPTTIQATFKMLTAYIKTDLLEKNGCKTSEITDVQNLTTIRSFDELKQTNQKYVVVRFHDRLGNLMFEYASTKSIAEDHCARTIVPESSPLLKAFSLQAVRVTEKLYEEILKTYKKTTRNFVHCCIYMESLLHGFFEKNGSQFEVIDGYMQSHRYFDHQSTVIRKEFTFLPEILERARRNIENATVALNLMGLRTAFNLTYVGVHIRHGDIAHNKNLINRGHASVNKDYIWKGMNYFRKKFRHVLFVVASDDMNWVKQNLNGSQSDTYFLPPAEREVDMATLSLCNHTVASTGSFSWWIAYLTNGETVYYSGWPTPGSVISKHVKKTDYYMEKWIPLS